ncbi:MAG TPA: N-acetylglucosamine-6-phosphate deacetylase, partial [Vicinamibacterales bacterium]
QLVLPDRMLSPGTLVIDGGRIAEIRSDAASGHLGTLQNHYIVPGFIDVHVHGVEGFDSLDGGDALAAIAARLPRYGVTAFCPTTVACGPATLRTVLDQVRRARETPIAGSARILPAHLESNFISAEYAGAQPRACLRLPADAFRAQAPGALDDEFTAADVLAEIARAMPDVGIVTLAPELDGGLDLVAWLAARGRRVSLGHSAATYEQALAAIAAGALHATHLFNRMPAIHHRAPGLVGAVLEADEVAAELICDGVHVHPALIRAAIAAKRPSRIFAITDSTAAAGLRPGSHASLGGQRITAAGSAAHLDDGTLAGSTLTMDRAFQMLVGSVGVSLIDAATMCSTTAARELQLVGHGMLKEGGVADLVVLGPELEVVQTYIGGQLVYTRNTTAANSV